MASAGQKSTASGRRSISAASQDANSWFARSTAGLRSSQALRLRRRDPAGNRVGSPHRRGTLFSPSRDRTGRRDPGRPGTSTTARSKGSGELKEMEVGVVGLVVLALIWPIGYARGVTGGWSKVQYDRFIGVIDQGPGGGRGQGGPGRGATRSRPTCSNSTQLRQAAVRGETHRRHRRPLGRHRRHAGLPYGRLLSAYRLTVVDKDGQTGSGPAYRPRELAAYQRDPGTAPLRFSGH